VNPLPATREGADKAAAHLSALHEHAVRNYPLVPAEVSTSLEIVMSFVAAARDRFDREDAARKKGGK
jgi:hypothetical protein